MFTRQKRSRLQDYTFLAASHQPVDLLFTQWRMSHLKRDGETSNTATWKPQWCFICHFMQLDAAGMLCSEGPASQLSANNPHQACLNWERSGFAKIAPCTRQKVCSETHTLLQISPLWCSQGTDTWLSLSATTSAWSSFLSAHLAAAMTLSLHSHMEDPTKEHFNKVQTLKCVFPRRWVGKWVAN